MKENINPAADAFIKACQRLHNLSNICMNWISVDRRLHLQIVPCESKCMRSARLAILTPVTHDVTCRSALQLTLLPATFDDPRHRGYDRPRWSIMIYSWLGESDTRRLARHLREQDDCKGVKFFIVKPMRCERVEL